VNDIGSLRGASKVLHPLNEGDDRTRVFRDAEIRPASVVELLDLPRVWTLKRGREGGRKKEEFLVK